MKYFKSDRWFLCILAAFIIVFTGIESAHAATLNVTKAADTNDGTCNADCSLREAIAAATAGDSITFNGAYTITLGSALAIDKNLTIDGSGHSVTISGADSYRVFVISTESVNITLNRLTVANGFNDKNGGAIYNIGTLNINNCAFLNNVLDHGDNGGAIYNSGSGVLNVTNSTFSGNRLVVSPGGSAIYSGGTLNVTNSTFSGNDGTTIQTFGTATLKNTIVTNSTGGNNCSGTIGDGGGNLVWGDETCPGISADPLLGALGDNGGPTQTFALLTGSPAIDAGTDAGCPSTDQRGYTRPVGATCDIGAFEYGSSETTPHAFTFIDQTGMPLSTVIVSNPITVTGIDVAAAVSITDGDYAISTNSGSTWGSWTSTAGTVSLNNQVKVRQTSSASYFTKTDAVLTIGGVSDTFSVTTLAAPTPAPTATPASSGGGGCFIATAAFGSAMERHVQILRDFRDHILLNSSVGKAFVQFYYRSSPPIADKIAQSEGLQIIARVLLMPVIVFAYLAFMLGMIPTLLIIANIFLLLFLFIRLPRRKFKHDFRSSSAR